MAGFVRMRLRPAIAIASQFEGKSSARWTAGGICLQTKAGDLTASEPNGYQLTLLNHAEIRPVHTSSCTPESLSFHDHREGEKL